MAGRIAYYGNIVTNGLILDLDAAKRDSYPGSGTVWRDIAGGVITGSLVNGPTYSNLNAGNIVFDGVDDTTNFGNILNIGLNSWTVSCWFKINSYSSGAQGIIGKTSPRSYIGRYTIVIDASILYALFQPTSTTYTVTTSITPYNNSQWHHAVMTIDRTGFLTLYMNGVSVGTPSNISSTSGANLNASTDYLFVGSYANNTGQTPSLFFNGSIGSAQIYNRALSTAEVLQNYNATKGRYQ
jgi:hypothetical protein